MRRKALCIGCALLITFGGALPSRAFSDDSPEAVAADALVVRPFCFVATVVGSVVFVLALPAAAISKSIDKTADALVLTPGRATFCRPLGRLSTLSQTDS